jgi:hypothetical protein
VNGGVPVTVCAKPNMNDKLDCPNGGMAQGVKTVVDAYQITGLTFFGFGGGATLGFTPNFGIAAEIKGMVMFTTFGFVLAPTIGPVVAF